MPSKVKNGAPITVLTIGLIPLALAHTTQPEDWSNAGAGDIFLSERWVDLDARLIAAAAAAGDEITLELEVASFVIKIAPDDRINSGPFGILDIETHEKTILRLPGISYVGSVVGRPESSVTLTLTGEHVRGAVMDGRTYFIEPGTDLERQGSNKLHRVTVFETPPLPPTDLNTLLPESQIDPLSHTTKTAHITFLGDKGYCDNVSDAGSRMQAAMTDLATSFQYLSIDRQNGGIWCCLTGNLGGSTGAERLDNFRN